jgi:DNA-binding transcriptional regulator of glucitol operon
VEAGPRIDGVLRSLLTPRWLLLHLLFIVVTIATGFLAVWQWDRAHDAGGSFQNLGYALQWPLFGAFTIFLWIRVARMDLDQQKEEGSLAPDAVEDAELKSPESVEKNAARRNRPLVPPPAPPVDADEDPELAEYNRYLAELNDRDKR